VPEDRRDVVIVGTGPAGIAFARSLLNLGSSARILMLEKGVHPRDKVCGDALTYLSVPLVQEIFPELSATIPTQSFTRRYRFYFPNGRYISGGDGQLDMMPRCQFDAVLCETLRGRPIEIMSRTTVVGLLKNGARVTGVVAGHEGSRFEIAADLVVGADGSTGIVRQLVRGTRGHAPGVAVRQYVRQIPETEDGLVFIIDPENNGYFWIFPYLAGAEQWANVGYYAPSGNRVRLKDRFQEILAWPTVKRYLGSGEFQGKLVGFPLNLMSTRWTTMTLDGPVWGPGYLLLGDAAGLISPYTGEGIAGALHSGKVAAALYVAGLPEEERGARYEREILRFARSNYELAEVFAVFRLPSLLPRPLRNLYMRVLPSLSERRQRKVSVSTGVAPHVAGRAFDYWALRTEPGNRAQLEQPKAGTDCVRVVISAASNSAPWAIQLNHGGFTTRASARYKVTVRARSDQPKLISVGLAKNVAPWDGLGFYQELTLNSAWRQFDFEFQALEDCGRARLHFDLAKSTTSVEIDGVTIRLAS